MLYKLENNELLSIEEFTINDGVIVYTDPDILKTYKPLIIKIKPDIDGYNKLIEKYIDTDDVIYLDYDIIEKTTEEIIEYNVGFWNENYFMVPVSPTEIYYAPHTTIMNGDVYNLLQDDLPIMLMGAAAQQLHYLELYTQPDFTQKISKEYMETLKVRISDQQKMTIILGYLSSLSYQDRILPTVI